MRRVEAALHFIMERKYQIHRFTEATRGPSDHSEKTALGLRSKRETPPGTVFRALCHCTLILIIPTSCLVCLSHHTIFLSKGRNKVLLVHCCVSKLVAWHLAHNRGSINADWMESIFFVTFGNSLNLFVSHQ